nr:ATP synthase F0 subunit 6 [Eutomostethus vegetus]
MMMNLFSIFDPMSSIFYLPLNWMSTTLGLFFLPNQFWLIMPRMNIMIINLMNKLHKEMKILLGETSHKGNSLILLSLMILIIYNNFLGIFPYIFTSTSHLTLTLSLAMPLWISIMLYGWINNMNFMFAHLVPQNTPNVLMPFMVLIETISNLIRTLTLAVRLTANMIAGHLLITLLSSLGNNLSLFYSIFLIFSQILLLILEFAVAIIQSYVFMILSTLYSSEVN